MKNVHKINAFLNKRAFTISLDMVQYDTGNVIEINVKDLDIPAGATGISFFKKPSGMFVYDDTWVTISGNVITVPVSNQALAESGTTMAQVSIASGTDILSTFGIKINVSPSYQNSSAEPSRTVVNAFDQAVALAIMKIGAVLDTTLSIPNKAADASAVGDAIAAVHDIKDQETLDAIINAIFADSIADQDGSILTYERLLQIMNYYLRTQARGNEVKIGGTLRLPNGDVIYTDGNSIDFAVNSVANYILNRITQSGGYTLPMASSNALGGIKANAIKPEYTEDVRMNENGFLFSKPYSLQVPHADNLGGVRAKPIVPEEDTQEVHVDALGFLWTKPTAGGGGGIFTSGRVAFVNPQTGTSSYIQSIIDDFELRGGGVIYFDAGDYILDRAIVVNGAINLIGRGSKLTALHAKKDGYMQTAPARVVYSVESMEITQETACIILGDNARHVTISGMTLNGERWEVNEYYKPVPTAAKTSGYGARFGLCVGNIENQNIRYDIFADSSSKVIDIMQGNKNLVIRDLTITGCDIGFFHGKYSYLVYTNNLWCVANGVGILTLGTDCTYDGISLDCNALIGAHFRGGNNRISNVKALFNGWLSGAPSYEYSFGMSEGVGVIIDGSKCLITNIECQDNFGLNFSIRGFAHTISNLLSDSSSNMKWDASLKNYPAYKFVGLKDSILNGLMIANYQDIDHPFTYGLEFVSKDGQPCSGNYVQYNYMTYSYDKGGPCNPCFTTAVSGTGGTVECKRG